MTTLPATIEDEMVNTIVHWIDLVAAALTSEAGRLRLRHDIRERLRQGTIPTMQVIAAARAGHQDADLALRELIAEMIDRKEDLPTTLAGYAQEAMFRAPTTYPPGRNIADTWMRDIGFAVLVTLAADHWRLPATRNRASKHPSACYVVSLALNCRGHNIGERQVERIFGNHGKLAERLSASIPT
jgi:hypothetical protein